MAAGHKIGTVFVELDLDPSRYVKGQQQLLKDAQNASSNLEQNFKNLGVKSDAVYDLMRAKAQKSFEAIAVSHKATANDIVRAEQAKAAQLQKIHEQQYGVQKSYIDKLKSHWMEATVAMAAAAAAISLGKTFLDAGIAAESMGKGLSAALGSVNAAAEATKFLRDESERLGLVFMDQVASYKSLAASARGTSMEGEQTRKIFTAITTASTALGLSADQTSGALNAIQQMMAKGTVQSEELRGQLSERLPGAFNMAAEAMGMTTAQLGKALEAGEVLATNMLPKLADVLINRYAAAATEAASGTQASINKMSTAWTALKVELVEDTMPAITKSINGLTALMKGFGSIVSTMKESWAFSVLLEDTKEVEKAVQDVVKAKTEAQIQSAAYSSHILRETDSIQQYVDMSEEREKAEKKAASEAKKAASEAEQHRKKALADAERHEAQLRREEAAAIAYNQVMDDLHSKIAAFQGDTYGAEIAKIEKEFERIAKTTGAANEELNQWNELARAAAGLKSVYDVVPEGKTSPYPDDPERRANEISDAYRNMYTDMKNISAEYYDFQFEMIDKQAKRYKELGIDDVMVAKWAANQKQKIGDEIITSAIQNAWKMFDVASSLYDKESGEYQKLQDMKKVAQAAELAMEVKKNITIISGYVEKMLASTAAAAVENSANASTAITGAVSSVAAQGSVPIAGFGLAAAMAAVMAGVLGIAGIAFSPGMSASAATAPTMQGPSGVLGAETGVASESITNSIELLQDTYNMEDQKLTDLYNEMVNLNHNITAVVTSIARTGGLTGINVDTTDKIGPAQSAWNQFTGTITQFTGDIVGGWLNDIVSGIVGWVFGGGSKTTVQWAGIEIGQSILGDILAGMQISARQFVSLHEEIQGGLFGGGGDRRWTEYSALNPQVTEALTKVFKNMSNILVYLAESLWVDVGTVMNYVFELTKIDLKGMTSEQANKTLNEYFSTIMDTAVDKLFGHILRQYQGLNEGLLETATRLIQDMQTVRGILSATNQSIKDGADPVKMIAFSESLIQIAGGLKNLTDAASTYYDKFFSDAEKQANLSKQLWEMMNGMNLALPETRDGYKDLIEGLDLSTEAGKKMYVTLLNAAGAADQYYSAVEEGKNKLAEFIRDYDAYYRSMVGTSSGLSTAIDAVNERYEKHRAYLTKLPGWTDAVTESYRQQTIVIRQLIANWATTAIKPLWDLEVATAKWAMGISGMTEKQIALATLMVYRIKQGMTSGGESVILTGMPDASEPDKLTAYLAELAQYYTAVVNALESTFEAFKKSREAITGSIVDINLEFMDSAQKAQYYFDQAVSLYTKFNGDITAVPGTVDKLHDTFLKYYEEEKSVITEKHNLEIEAIKAKSELEIQNINAIKDKLLSLRYSSYNLALPMQKVEVAANDYLKMFAAAKEGKGTSVSDYLAFVETFLQSSQDAYKSSATYLAIYKKVTEDIASLDKSGGKSIESLTEEQNKLVQAQTNAMTSELRTLGNTITQALSALNDINIAGMNEVSKQIYDAMIPIGQIVSVGEAVSREYRYDWGNATANVQLTYADDPMTQEIASWKKAAAPVNLMVGTILDTNDPDIALMQAMVNSVKTPIDIKIGAIFDTADPDIKMIVDWVNGVKVMPVDIKIGTIWDVNDPDTLNMGAWVSGQRAVRAEIMLGTIWDTADPDTINMAKWVSDQTKVRAEITIGTKWDTADTDTIGIAGWIAGTNALRAEITVGAKLDAAGVKLIYDWWNMINTTPATINVQASLSEAMDSSIFSTMNYHLQQIHANTASLNSSFGFPSYREGGIASGPASGYMATLHGTELVVSPRNAVPVTMAGGSGGGYGDPELKAMIKELIAVTRQKQNVTLKVTDDKSFPAYIRSEADVVRVSANERKGVERRPLFR